MYLFHANFGRRNVCFDGVTDLAGEVHLLNMYLPSLVGEIHMSNVCFGGGGGAGINLTGEIHIPSTYLRRGQLCQVKISYHT